MWNGDNDPQEYPEPDPPDTRSWRTRVFDWVCDRLWWFKPVRCYWAHSTGSLCECEWPKYEQ
jgi:hypothetical protein